MCISVQSNLNHKVGNWKERKAHKKAKKSRPGEYCHANIDNNIVEESIGDSIIANSNRDKLKQAMLNEASRTQEFVKNIGLVALGNEEEIVRQLEKME